MPDQSTRHHLELTRAVRDLFLPLGYSDEEAEDFLQSQKASPPDPADLGRLETEAGPALARIRKDSTWDISYLIPANWDRQYEILEEALKAITSEAERGGAEDVLIRIEESPPSHNAYFAGMLPLLGFTLAPRAGLAAPLEAIDLLSPPELPDEIQEVTIQESDLAEIVEWYADALLSHRTTPVPDEERRRGNEEMLSGFVRYLQGESAQAWVVLGDGDRTVALAIGTCGEDGHLTLSQIGVAATHRGLGLGRYIIMRCMQKLLDRYGDRGKLFWVRTGRTWAPAYGLYQRLGFQPRDLYSFAQYSCCH